MGQPDDHGFTRDRLRNAVREQLIGSEIVVLKKTTSTNDEADSRMRNGASEGLVVFAEEQTAGRGQRGNAWESRPGTSLLFSIGLRPRIKPEESPRLIGWATAAISRCLLEKFSLRARIKPPNDIYIGARKLAGILVEMRAREGEPHDAIVGIGLNVNQVQADFSGALQSTATSVALETGRTVDRAALAIDLLRILQDSYVPAVAG